MFVIALTLAGCGAAETDPDPEPAPRMGCTFDSRATAVPCGTAEDYFNSPAEHDALVGCTHVPGQTHVSDRGDLTDLSFLAGVQDVGRLTFFRNEQQISADGLESLEHATRFGFNNMYALQDISALGDLCQVDEVLYVQGTRLETLDGLEGLRIVGDLTIQFNEALTDISALEGIEVVEGDLLIERNPALSQADAEALAQRLDVVGTISVLDNGEG